MKKIIISLILLISILTTVHAAIEIDEVPPSLFEDNSTVLDPLSEYLVNTIQPLLRRVSVLVGGIFGLYLILILARIHYERKKVKLLNDIRYDLDQLNIHYQVPYSRESNGFFRKLWRRVIFKFKQTKKNSSKIKKNQEKNQNKKSNKSNKK